MVKGQAGKGDKYRPVDRKKWDKNWDKAFGKEPKSRKKSPSVMKAGGIIDMSNIEESENNNE